MAIDLCSSGKSPKAVAEGLGVRKGLIYRWTREYNTNGDLSFLGNGNDHLAEEEAEITRLEEQLKDIHEEPSINKNENFK